MEREIGASEAMAIAQEARKALFAGFEANGFPIRTGQVNADGHVLTDEDIQNLYQAVDEIGVQALSGANEINEDKGK